MAQHVSALLRTSNAIITTTVYAVIAYRGRPPILIIGNAVRGKHVTDRHAYTRHTISVVGTKSEGLENVV